MNTVLTVASFIIAVYALLKQNTPIGKENYPLWAAGIVLLFCVTLFWLEKKYKNSPAKITDWIAFHTKKAEKYLIESKRCEYSFIGNNEWHLIRDYSLISKTKDLKDFDDRFCWSGDSSTAEISVRGQDGHSISRKRNNGIWTYYTIGLNHPKPKNASISAGSIVTKLDESKKPPRPFFSMLVDRKTKYLQLCVRPNLQKNPRNAKLRVFSSAAASEIVDEQDLVIDEGEIIQTFKYPRVGRLYQISWEED